MKRGAAVAAAEQVFQDGGLTAVRVLVTEKLSEQGLELLRRDFQVDVRTGARHRRPRRARSAPYDALDHPQRRPR